jgi:hypothetical protein
VVDIEKIEAFRGWPMPINVRVQIIHGSCGLLPNIYKIIFKDLKAHYLFAK